MDRFPRSRSGSQLATKQCMRGGPTLPEFFFLVKSYCIHFTVMAMGLINANPIIHEKKERRARQAPETTDENAAEPIDQLEIFDILLNDFFKYIKDPEHPYSLEQLNVVTEDSIELNDESNYVRVTFTPTVEHCSMATIIGLCIRVKLVRSLPPRYKVDIRVAPGSHATEAAVNKQLNDKERVAAALENPNLLDMVEECLSPTFD
ncbi:Protein AE7 [Zea mays]|uniref:Protein AE7 n=1 Tax=Zea mays TaxID=4577 RepID=A0A1D6JDE4_MAIZE|nr:Protein AE7 [Zea mays]